MLGQILLVAIAVAVTLLLTPASGATFGQLVLGAVAGNVASQTVGVVTGIQDKFSFKGVALAALSAGVGAGVGSVIKGAVAGSQFLGNVIRGAVSSAVTQGVATATGLQSKFNWAGVAAAGIGAGVGEINFGSGDGGHIAATSADVIAQAATRSVIEGSSFGDNLIAQLPSAIGNMLGRAAARGIAAAFDGVSTPERQVTDSPVAGGGGGNPLPRKFGGDGGSMSDLFRFDAHAIATGKVKLTSGETPKSYRPENLGEVDVVLQRALATLKNEADRSQAIANAEGWRQYYLSKGDNRTLSTLDWEPVSVTPDAGSTVATYNLTNAIGPSLIETKLAGLDASGGARISSYAPSTWDDIRSSFLISSSSGRDLRDSGYRDWSAGSYFNGATKYVGSVGMRTLQAAQWGAFEVPVSLAPGNGFTPTARDRQDAALISFAAGGFGMARRGAVGAAESVPLRLARPGDANFIGPVDFIGPRVPAGRFSISDWSGYPAGLAKPQGPFRLIGGAEYDSARSAANNANRAMHRADPSLNGFQIHEIQTVKFGGSPTNPLNKVPLTPTDHSAASVWWYQLQRNLGSK